MPILWIVLGVIALIVVWLFSSYNKFVTLKAQIEASIQEIGNQLKRQADLIPNLVSSVKGYMKHEEKALKMITDARKQVLEVVDSGNATDLVAASDKLQSALGSIRAVFESTPQLQAAGPTQNLMNELRDTSDKVMYARRTLIDLTADYNILLATFPSNLIAGMFGFTKQPGLAMPNEEEAITVKDTDLKTPKVDL